MVDRAAAAMVEVGRDGRILNFSDGGPMKRRPGVICLGVLTLLASAAEAQQGSPPPVAITSCSYLQCGLGIAPSLTSLDVVQGSGSTRVARLGFFWSSDIRPVFAASDSAVAYAGRAVRTRRAAAALTDTGILLFGIAAAIAASEREIGRTATSAAAGGAILLAFSYPIQLRADAHLSRAVWWYNSRFARP